MCVHGKEGTSPNASVWVIGVFLIVFGQKCSSMAQRNKVWSCHVMVCLIV